MSQRYPTVLFDLDHTLFDFEYSKTQAFGEVMGTIGITDPARVGALKHTLSTVERPLWAQLEAGALTLDTLNDERFDALVTAARLDADATALAASYLHLLGRRGRLLPGARALLDDLAASTRLGLVSNGYAEVQRSRLELFDLDRYFEVVVISNEVGVAKPDPAFFRHATQPMGLTALDQVLVVGDSLSSDIAGAAAAGLSACWFNPEGHPLPEGTEVEHVVGELPSVLPIVTGTDPN